MLAKCFIHITEMPGFETLIGSIIVFFCIDIYIRTWHAGSVKQYPTAPDEATSCNSKVTQARREGDRLQRNTLTFNSRPDAVGRPKWVSSRQE